MELTAVKSSNVRQIGYDAEAGVCRVVFKNGATYDYEGVDAETFAEFAKSESKGRFVARSLKGKFKTKRIETKETEQV